MEQRQCAAVDASGQERRCYCCVATFVRGVNQPGRQCPGLPAQGSDFHLNSTIGYVIARTAAEKDAAEEGRRLLQSLDPDRTRSAAVSTCQQPVERGVAVVSPTQRATTCCLRCVTPAASSTTVHTCQVASKRARVARYSWRSTAGQGERHRDARNRFCNAVTASHRPRSTHGAGNGWRRNGRDLVGNHATPEDLCSRLCRAANASRVAGRYKDAPGSIDGNLPFGLELSTQVEPNDRQYFNQAFRQTLRRAVRCWIVITLPSGPARPCTKLASDAR